MYVYTSKNGSVHVQTLLLACVMAQKCVWNCPPTLVMLTSGLCTGISVIGTLKLTSSCTRCLDLVLQHMMSCLLIVPSQNYIYTLTHPLSTTLQQLLHPQVCTCKNCLGALEPWLFRVRKPQAGATVTHFKCFSSQPLSLTLTDCSCTDLVPNDSLY